nr:integrase, catalytic region, zinc finger, CCHC-type, peptidase aspartic, catalytic [Tanacetum cinerariifolium]
MSNQQDIYAAGSESHPPMLNKENYVPWSSRLLWYAKSRPKGKLIHNSILNGPYVRKMILEPGDANRDITVTETFHLQTDDELSDKELKQIEADDQAIQTILLGLPEDIYTAEKKAKLFNEWERFTSNEGESIESYYHGFLKLMNDLKRNKHFPEKIASNMKFLNNLQPEWSRHVTIVHQTKDLHTSDYTQLYDFLKYNQKEVDELKAERLAKTQVPLALMENSNNPYVFPAPHQDQSSFNQNYLQITQPGMNMGQDRQMQMVRGNGENQFRQYARQNAGNPAGYNDVIGNQVNQNAVQNPRVQNVGSQNGLIGVQGNGNQNQTGNHNLVAARAEGNAAGQNGNQIRCYNCRGVGYYARNYTVRPRRRDAAYLQTQLLIAQKEEAGSNSKQKKDQYTELLEPIPESHQVPQNDNDVISEDTSMEQGGETVEQHPVNYKETRALYESLYQNLAIEVEKVNSVNRKLKETNADMTTELVRFKNQERLIQRGLQAQVRVVRTDKGTKILNQTLLAYFAAEGIKQQTSVALTPEQNGVVERRNRTLVEAARTMLSAA